MRDSDQYGGVVGVTFKGKVNFDIWDSVENWASFAPPTAPLWAPNAVYIVAMTSATRDWVV